MPTTATLLLLLAAQQTHATTPKTFEGRAITLTIPETSPDGYFPKGEAKVCLEGPPSRQCYTAPKYCGRFPEVQIITLEPNLSALFFTAASGGVSGFEKHYALLRPGTDSATLDNLFEQET